MRLGCLDLEGVIIPEIWQELARQSGVDDLMITTRDVPDYHELMARRFEIARAHGLSIHDVHAIVERLDALPGAEAFLTSVREVMPIAIVSDTFASFVQPVMRRLGRPMLICNEIETDADGMMTGFVYRHPRGKAQVVESFQAMGYEVTAAGDSHNDVGMLTAAERGAFFHAPENIAAEYPKLPAFNDYKELRSFFVAPA